MPACFMIVLICNGRIPKISSSFIDLKTPPHFCIIQIYVMEGVFMNVILFFLLIIWCDLIKGLSELILEVILLDNICLLGDKLV